MGRVPRHTTVVAYLALFVALGAGAYAAGLGRNSVTSKNIAPEGVKASDLAPNAVDGSKVKDDSLTASDLAPGAVDGSKVKDYSLTGADVDESTLQGLGGSSTPQASFTPGDPLPSGKTETGAWAWNDAFGNPGTEEDVGVTLPFAAPVALGDFKVNFTPSGLASDDDASCTGTAETPTAPPGQVCIYIAHGNSSPGALAGYAIGNPGPSKVGFEIASKVPGDNGLAAGTWAYTAP